MPVSCFEPALALVADVFAKDADEVETLYRNAEDDLHAASKYHAAQSDFFTDLSVKFSAVEERFHRGVGSAALARVVPWPLKREVVSTFLQHMPILARDARWPPAEKMRWMVVALRRPIQWGRMMEITIRLLVNLERMVVASGQRATAARCHLRACSRHRSEARSLLHAAKTMLSSLKAQALRRRL